jgi:hypothetical protein
MKSNELKAEIIRNGFTVKKIATAIGIQESTFYRKLRGDTQFKQCEILALKQILGLSNDDIIDIFFYPSSVVKDTKHVKGGKA